MTNLTASDSRCSTSRVAPQHFAVTLDDADVGRLTLLSDSFISATRTTAVANVRVSVVGLVIALITFTGTSNAIAQRASSVTALEARIRAARSTCVRIISGSDHSSGVIASRSGHVLTVAHGLAADTESAHVVLPDRRTAVADVIKRDASADVALLKLRKSMDLPASWVATSAATPIEELSKNAVVFALGFPASNHDASVPVCRLGSLAATSNSALRTTCILTAGDSGGPLFNADGRLLAIHQKIGPARGLNLHLTLNACRKSLGSTGHTFDSVETHRSFDQTVQSLTDLESQLAKPASDLTLKLLDASTKQPAALATQVTTSIAVTKASLIRPNTELLATPFDSESAARPWPVRVLGRIASDDLLLLKIHADFADSFPAVRLAARPAEWADIVWSPVGHRLSIVGRTDLTVKSGQVNLGCLLDQRPTGLWVTRVSPNSTAAAANLQPGDRLASLRGHVVNTFNDLQDLLQPLEPGDWIGFRFQRGSEFRATVSQLQSSGDRTLSRTEYLDGRAGHLSQRRSGFSDVFQHDGSQSPEQMGTPVFSTDGRLLGINIARRSREAVLAIPIERILKHISGVEAEDSVYR